MTTHSLPVRTETPARTPVEKPARGGRRLLRQGAGRQHHAGPLAYVLLVVMAVLSIFPLYWTCLLYTSPSPRDS